MDIKEQLDKKRLADFKVALAELENKYGIKTSAAISMDPFAGLIPTVVFMNKKDADEHA